MSKIIAVANQKGGVGKTTTCINLGVGLFRQRKKVLLVDADPQGSMTIGLGYPKNLPATLESMMRNVILGGDFDSLQAVLKHQEGVDVIPANILLTGMELSLAALPDRERVLKSYLDRLKGNYDYVLVDCGPSLGLLTINALTAADSVLIPVQPQRYAVEGLQELFVTVRNIRRNYNPGLQIEGILFNIDNHYNNARCYKEAVINTYGADVRIFNCTIPNYAKISEAPNRNGSIFQYPASKNEAAYYETLTKEVIEHES